MSTDVRRTEEDRSSSASYEANGSYPAYPDAYDHGGQRFGLQEALRLVRRRWEIVASVVVLGTVATSVLAYARPDIYVAEVRLLIEPEHRVVDLDSVVDAVGSDAAAIETQINLLKSTGFIWSFATHHFGEAEVSLDAAARPSINHSSYIEVEPKGVMVDSLPVRLPRESRVEPEELAVSSDIAGQLVANLSVSQLGRSFILTLAYSSIDPREAAEIANALAQYYIDDQTAQRRAATGEASHHLRRRLAELEAELRQAEEAAQRYRALNMLGTVPDVNISSMQMSDLVNLVVQARASRAEKEARLDYIKTLRMNGQSLESLTEVISSPYVADLWQQSAGLRQREAELRLEYGKNHPSIINLLAEQEEIAARISLEVERIIANTINEIEVLNERERSLQSDIDKLANTAANKANLSEEASVELRLLEQKVRASQRIYESFLTRLKETQEQEAIIEANTTIVTRANIPSQPSNRSPSTIVFLGLIASSALGVSLAFLRDRMDRSIKTKQDVVDSLSFDCLALVPYLKIKVRDGLKLHEYLIKRPLSIYSETIRSIHTQMRMKNYDSSPQVIQITSSFPSEGKTSLAVSLATSLALDGFSTILMDLDLRHPSIGREVQLDDVECLVDYIEKDDMAENSIIKSVIPNFDVIGAKKRPTSPNRLLTSDRLIRLVDSLRSRYDHIIIDSTPALGLSDAKSVLSYADTVIFVTQWNKTTLDDAKEALKELQNCQANISGVAVTQVDLAKNARNGYGGIGTYYKKYSEYYRN